MVKPSVSPEKTIHEIMRKDNAERIFDKLAQEGVVQAVAHYDSVGSIGNGSVYRADFFTSTSREPIAGVRDKIVEQHVLVKNVKHPSTTNTGYLLQPLTLDTAVKYFCYNTLGDKHEYWDGDAGSMGTFDFSVPTRNIRNTHHRGEIVYHISVEDLNADGDWSSSDDPE